MYSTITILLLLGSTLMFLALKNKINFKSADLIIGLVLSSMYCVGKYLITTVSPISDGLLSLVISVSFICFITLTITCTRKMLKSGEYITFSEFLIRISLVIIYVLMAKDISDILVCIASSNLPYYLLFIIPCLVEVIPLHYYNTINYTMDNPMNIANLLNPEPLPLPLSWAERQFIADRLSRAIVLSIGDQSFAGMQNKVTYSDAAHISGLNASQIRGLKRWLNLKYPGKNWTLLSVYTNRLGWDRINQLRNEA